MSKGTWSSAEAKSEISILSGFILGKETLKSIVVRGPALLSC